MPRTNESGRLRINPDPLKVVPDAQREVWHRQRGFRCDYEDGRGRCTSTETRSVWVKDHTEAYCEKHRPEVGRASRLLPRPREVVPTLRQRRKPRAAQLGVTLDEYDRLLVAQGGGCAICGNPPKTRRLHVDHDHKTGQVRGLLCHRCNRALPNWVTPEWLYAALCYLAPDAWLIAPGPDGPQVVRRAELRP